MSLTLRARPGRLLAILIAMAVFIGFAIPASAAFAAEITAPLDAAATAQLLQQLGTSQVDEAVCTSLCHGNIAQTKNYASAIKFTHGNHIIIQCSSCHTKFPHQASGTVKPTMKGCFDCHGLRHGSMGEIAKGECTACHVQARWEMDCPYSKTTPQWSGKGHVSLSNTSNNTECMRCHTANDCTTCHDREGIIWTPKTGWEYDASDGCQACHGSTNLLKQDNGIAKSFQVSGLEDSVHRNLSCQSCHPDFRYDDKPAQTKLWTVNAGLSCANCHQNATKTQDRAPVAMYEKSVHAQKIRDGEYNSATCGSCHGGHFIYALDTEAAKSKMHASAYRVCARCHAEQYESYNDYYHGRAYKEGAGDSPACWQCHAAHDVRPKADPLSAVSDKNVGATCGQPGCHKGSSEQFGAQAADLIHRKVDVQKANPVVEFLGSMFKSGS